MAGYSGKPLAQKLGITAGAKISVINPSSDYPRLLGSISKSLTFNDTVTKNSTFVHLFVIKRAELQKRLTQIRSKLADNGVVWVSWPKKASGVETDVTEDVIRAVALPMEFVDVKVCAVDDVWSGLKLVIRREHRKGPTGK
jgi:hypothetical protein